MITRNKLIFFVIVCLVLWKLFSLLTFSREDSSSETVQEELSTKSAIEPLRVLIYYETLCPDSRSFFIRQLLPAYEKAPDLFDLSLIPYGKASTEQEASGKYLFRCQHGPLECQGNKVHACAIHHVASPSLQLRYTTCMISDNMDPEDAGRKCARSLEIEWEPILKCSQSKDGDELLAQHGKATSSLQPPVSFIPTIQVNESLDKQPSLLKDLFRELCSRFEVKPPACL